MKGGSGQAVERWACGVACLHGLRGQTQHRRWTSGTGRPPPRRGGGGQGPLRCPSRGLRSAQSVSARRAAWRCRHRRGQRELRGGRAPPGRLAAPQTPLRQYCCLWHAAACAGAAAHGDEAPPGPASGARVADPAAARPAGDATGDGVMGVELRGPSPCVCASFSAAGRTGRRPKSPHLGPGGACGLAKRVAQTAWRGYIL